MERAIWNNKEYYAFDIMEDFALETEVRKVSSKELYCPDPCCQKPLLRYCHGDVKDAYFAHLENEECDYGNFDKGTTWSVKKIRRILYEYFKALGYEVQLEQKVLPRHYTHILLTAGGKKTAIEIGTRTSIANYIFSVEKQYAERGIAVKWVVISKNDEHRKEVDVSYLKRYCFNTSTNNEVLIVDEEGQRFTQIKEVLKKRRDELIRARELRHAKAKQKHHTKSLTDCVLKSAEIAAYADEEAVKCFEEYRERLEQIEIERKIKEMEM